MKPLSDLAAEHRTERCVRAALVPFVWLGVATAASSLTALLVLTLAPTLLPGSPALTGWSPFASAVELELPDADGEALDSLARALEQALPGCFVERGTSDETPSIVVVAQADKAALVGEVTSHARAQGLATGAFSMGLNLGRAATRIFTQPGSAASAARSLLPWVLFFGSAVLLMLGQGLRRRQNLSATRPGGSSPSAPRSVAGKLSQGVALGLLLSLLIAALSELAARLGAPLREQPWLAEALRTGGWQWLLVVFVVVVLAPLGEEVFFRGYLLPALTTALGPPFGILLSAVAFAAIHAHAPAFPAYLLYGLALALAARRTGSLHVPIAAHTTVNTLAVATLAWSG